MILITGANGQLGQCFRQLAEERGVRNILFCDSSTLNISDGKAVHSYFREHSIRWCINCAAYTMVDRAELEMSAAYRVNVTGVRNLAKACAQNNAGLIHFSTDYVYQTQQNRPYEETDRTRPVGVYAKTKLAGERAALKINPLGTMVIRTSWVYAAHGHNFVNTMLRLGLEKEEIGVVFDQIGTPTYAPDLALAVWELLERSNTEVNLKHQMAGIWHYSNEGVASWYDFAVAIMELGGRTCVVRPIESRQYPTPASRPFFSVLNKRKIKEAFGLTIPHWRTSLQRCIEIKRDKSI